MARVMYDLAGADDRRFSPYCWRVRASLAHKGLPAEFVPWHFTEQDRIAFSGQARVPVLVDGETVVADSWAIMDYLDRTYPDRPLFDGAQARAHALFVKHWAEMVLHPAFVPLIINDIFRAIRPEERDYFRTSREKMLGRRLEDFPGDAEARLSDLARALNPLRQTVKLQPFLGGAAPSGADFLPFGTFQWVRTASGRTFIEDDADLNAWYQRVEGHYAGALRAA